MGPIIRINTTYLVEVTENDIKHIDKFGLDEFILGDMRNKRKLVVSGKSSLRRKETRTGVHRWIKMTQYGRRL